MPALAKNPLGKSALAVARLGLGGHTFLKRFGGQDRVGEAELCAILVACLDCGLNFLDATYDEERELLGRCLKQLGRREQTLVSCWAPAQKTPDGPATIAECERALKQFGLERLDHFYIEVDVSDEHAQALATLKKSGKIRLAGAYVAERALKAPAGSIDAAVQVFNFYRPEAASVLRALKERGIGTIGAEPLGRGRFLQEYGADAPKAASALLRYAIAQPFIDTVLLTMNSMDLVGPNVDAALAPTFNASDEALLRRGRGYDVPFDPWK